MLITMNIKINNKIQHGFTLVEVMVAMVIFSVGLLGLAGLQSLGMTNNQTAYNRTVAMQLASNMSDRMRTNVTAVDAGTYSAVPALAVPVGLATDCIAATCTPGQLAAFDIFEWQTTIAAELPQGRGSVTAVPLPPLPNGTPGGNQFVICVMWNELKVPPPFVPPPCTAIPSTYNPSAHFKFYTLRFE